MAWLKLFVSFVFLAHSTAGYEGDANSANQVCGDKSLRIRHGDAAMKWSAGIFYGRSLKAATFDPTSDDQILIANRRSDGYWKIMTGGLFEFCLQPLPLEFLRTNGQTKLGMEVCDDNEKAQAWFFSVVPGNEDSSFTIHSFSLQACLMVNDDGSYGFQKCEDSPEVFLVEQDVYAS